MCSCEILKKLINDIGLCRCELITIIITFFSVLFLIGFLSALNRFIKWTSEDIKECEEKENGKEQ